MSTKSAAISGGKWVTTSTAISTIFTFVQLAILARVLSPSVFGIVSVSTLIVNFFNLFGSLGFANSVIYKQESDKKVLSSLYILNITLGIILFLLIFFCTPLIVSYYKDERLRNVVRLASLYFLITYYGQMYLFLLQKNLQFKAIAIIDITASVISVVVTIALAYQGYEELSLILGQLVMVVVKVIMQIYCGRHLFTPALHLDFVIVKEHIKFGIYNIGEGIISFIQSNSDNIAVGGILGVKALGYYTVASQLTIFPVIRLNPIILQVAYPILAKMKEDSSQLKKSYLKILDLISYLNFPLLAGLFITAISIVPLIYGPGWEPTIDLMKIFVFVSIFTCLSHPLFTLAYSKGRPDLLFYLNLVTLVIKLPLLYLFGKQWGVIGIAYSYLVATFINMILSFFIVQYLVGDFILDFFKNLFKPIIFCVLMIAGIIIYKSSIGYVGLFNTITEICLGGIIYVGLTLLFNISILKSYRQ